MKFKKGFTLIEILTAVVLFAAFISVCTLVFVNAGKASQKSQLLAIAQGLAQEKMEEIVSQDFDAVLAVPQTAFTNDLSDYFYEIQVMLVTGEFFDQPAMASNCKKVAVMVGHGKMAQPLHLESLKFK